MRLRRGSARSAHGRVGVAVLGLLGPMILASPSFGAAASPAGDLARPGRLIAASPFTARLLPLLPLPAKAWKITYASRTAMNRDVIVTGTVLVPRSRWKGPGPRPLVGFAPGTQGLGDQCTVSGQLAAGVEYESPVLQQLLGRGWAVAVPDYQGLGTPGEHPYVVGRALGRNVLDAMRAARALRGAELDRHGPAAIYGYSEGGQAAGWAIQLQPTYAPDVRIVGGAVGAVPTDFTSLATSLNRSPLAFLLLYASIGFDAAYPELDLDSFLNTRGRELAARLRHSCIVDAVLQGLLVDKDYRHYVTRDPFQSAAWRARLAQNGLGTIKPRVPVIVGGPRQDEVIPFSQDAELYRRWSRLGADVRFAELPLAEHLSGGFEFAPIGIRFLAARLARSASPR